MATARTCLNARRLCGQAGASALAAFFVVAGISADEGGTWSFDNLPAGRPPSGFFFASIPNDQTGNWSVVREASNFVLAHTPRKGGAAVQLAVVEGTAFGDVVISTRLRFTEAPGSAGVTWRYRDPNNYYLAALDLRNQDVRIYRVAGGNRTRLEDEDDLELDARVWHTLKIEHRGMRIRVWINGVPVAGARDRTAQEPGAIGVWTTADSGSWFDDLHAESVPESPRSNRRD